MADFFSAFLEGALGEGNQFKDFQHASRLYIDDRYSYAPKQGFLYYVIFSLNQDALPNNQWAQTSQREIGLLVKNCDLPKFNITTETVNQYNRKVNVQSKITYSPVSFGFHDDHSNTTHNLWKSYYAYYYADGKTSASNSSKTVPSSAGGIIDSIKNLFSRSDSGPSANQFEIPPAFDDTKYMSPTNPFQTNGYGLNNNQDKPFFRYITIYQLNRKRYTAFTLVNPLITEWSHDKLDQSSNNKLLENKMTIAYEAVLYGEGKVKTGTRPGGFSEVHYDLTPSPLSILGGGSESLFGPGGVIDGVDELFGDLGEIASGNGSPADYVKAAISGANIIRNASNITGAQAASEGLAVLTGGIGALAGNGNNLPTSVSAGAGALAAGFALSMYSGNSSNAQPDAIQSDITANQESQVTQADLPAPQTTTLSLNTLPSPLPTSKDGLNTLLSQQQQIANNLKTSIAVNTALKTIYDKNIALAKQNNDSGALQTIYSNMAANNYTDPAKLQNSLDQTQNNILEVQSALKIANATSTGPSTLGKDTSISGSAFESKLDSSINTDYKINQNTLSSISISNSVRKEGYQAS